MNLHAFRDSINTKSRHIQLPLIWNYNKCLRTSCICLKLCIQFSVHYEERKWLGFASISPLSDSCVLEDQIISGIKWVTSQHASQVSGLEEINKLQLILKAGEGDSCAQLAS
jgi:hypothetical protein